MDDKLTRAEAEAAGLKVVTNPSGEGSHAVVFESDIHSFKKLLAYLENHETELSHGEQRGGETFFMIPLNE